MKNSISFVLDGNVTTIDFSASDHLKPTTTVLNYMRSLPAHRGVKEGCAEGDCGACTVVLGELAEVGQIAYKAVDSCLMFLPMLHGKQLITIENLREHEHDLHPVQEAMVEQHGSQCGFCTPGIVMSMFGLYKNSSEPSMEKVGHALAGNLCRCTGYRPIIQAAASACASNHVDHFTADEPRIASLLHSILKESVSIAAHEQRYEQPASLADALKLLKEMPTVSIVNGATDVALKVTKRFESIPQIVDLSRVPELKQVSRNGDRFTIGAGLPISSVRSLVEHEFPALYDMLTVFAAEQIRNVATLGGNIGTASPIGDALPVLIAYGASIELTSLAGSRTVRADQFVLGYRKTERHPDELITNILIPQPRSSVQTKSYKISKRHDLDISTLSGGFSVELANDKTVASVILAFGGMAERTKRAASVEKAIVGKPWTEETIVAAQKFIEADFKPLTDVRGSAEFRILAAKNLLMKFWLETKS